jgi:CRISPR-associated protein Cas1
MIKRIVEISLGQHCSLKYDNLIIKKGDGQALSIPLEDLGCVVVDNLAASFSSQLLVAFTRYNIAVVFCGEQHLPMGQLLPYNSHHIHTKIIKAQAIMSEPKKKNLWQKIIKNKINEQAQALKLTGNKKGHDSLLSYIPKVLSGDSKNIEGVVAALYFKELFGVDFKREYKGAQETNSLLNYGYAIMRSISIRGACGAGLHPSLGIFHKNQFNPYCLADDLMEILRPLVDLSVYQLNKKNTFSLNKESKKELLKLLLQRVEWREMEFSLIVGMQKFSQSIVKYILNEQKEVYIPKIL